MSTQTKIKDSKSYVFSLQHFYPEKIKNKKKHSDQQNHQINYIVASTLDKWLGIRSISLKDQKPIWTNIFDLLMSMPVVNSFIELDEYSEPQGLVLAYFDGSIQYSPWKKIQKYYQYQISAAKQRKISKTYSEILQRIKRPAYINTIEDDQDNIEKAFLYETICFIYKKQDFIYTTNFKGELKIFELRGLNEIKRVNYHKFHFKITKTCLLNNFSAQSDEQITIAVCFEGKFCPFVFRVSPSTTEEQLQTQLQALNQKYNQIYEQQYKVKQNIKLIQYDPFQKQIITVTDQNQFRYFSIQQTQFLQTQILLQCILQKVFTIPHKKDSTLTQFIYDISVKNRKMLITAQSQSFLYDLKQNMMERGQILKNNLLHVGKLINWNEQTQEALIAVKKNFDLKDFKRPSTTIHLVPVGKSKSN